MPLTDVAVRNAKPTEKLRRLADEKGLALEVRPQGTKAWRFRYRIAGVEKMLSLGLYPDISLAQARERRDEARKLVARGIDPSLARRAERATQRDEAKGSFEAVAREWFATKRDTWSPGYGDKIIRRLEVDVFPWLGSRPVAEISPPELLQVLRRIEGRGALETAHRARENCSQVLRYAVATGRLGSDPSRDLRGALRNPPPRHFPAILDEKRLGELLRACDSYRGTPVVRAALAVAPILLLRPGELRHGRWEEVDLDAALWTVPAARMKRSQHGKRYGPPHRVPLPTQVVAVLRDLRPLTEPSGWIFRGERHHDRPMSENSVNAALRAMGFPQDEVVGHGFRATARTLLHERLDFPPEVIEAALAHEVPDSLGRAYNRTSLLDQRRQMLQAWADHLDQLRRESAANDLPRRAVGS